MRRVVLHDEDAGWDDEDKQGYCKDWEDDLAFGCCWFFWVAIERFAHLLVLVFLPFLDRGVF